MVGNMLRRFPEFLVICLLGCALLATSGHARPDRYVGERAGGLRRVPAGDGPQVSAPEARPVSVVDTGNTSSGPDTLQSNLGCVLSCPDGATIEGEPTCYEEYNDAINGGCRAHPVPPVFGTVALDETICGTSGNYDHRIHCTPSACNAGPNVECECTQAACVTDANCAGNPCVGGVCAMCEDLSALMTCAAGDTPGVPCTGDGDCPNGGAGSCQPNASDVGKCIGEMENWRDRDMYEIQTTQYTNFTWTVEAEFNALIGLIEMFNSGSGVCADGTGFVSPLALPEPCVPTAVVTAELPPGTHWFYVAAAADSGTTCGSDYVATLTGSVNTCANTCGTAYEITGLPFQRQYNTCLCENDYHEQCGTDNTLSPDEVYVYRPDEDQTIAIDLCTADAPTRVFVYEDTCPAPESGPTGNPYACADEVCGGGLLWANLEGLVVTQGYDYYIVIEADSGACGWFELSITEQLGECDYGNNSLGTSYWYSQLDPTGIWHAEVADHFILEEGDPGLPANPCTIDEIQFVTRHENWNGACLTGAKGACEDNPADYLGVLVTIYPDLGGLAGPAGLPDLPSDGSGGHTGQTIYEMTVLPARLSWVALPSGDYAITLDVSGLGIALAKDQHYWLALAPVVPYTDYYRTALVTTDDFNGNGLQHVFDQSSPEWVVRDGQNTFMLVFGAKSPAFPSGACCDATSYACFDTRTQPACEAAGGWWVGGETCPGYTCALLGACCDIPGETCLGTMASYDCQLAGGSWMLGEDCNAPNYVCPPAPSNDDCTGAARRAVPSTSTGDTTLASDEGSLPVCLDELDADYYVGTETLWYSVCGTGNTMTASMCAQNQYDGWMAVYCSGCGPSGDCVDAGDDTCGVAGGPAEVTWCSEAGVEYLIMVSGWDGAAGAFQLDITEDGVPCAPPPTCALVACSAYPPRLYVDALATGAGTGFNWTDAFPDLQDAFSAARSSGGIVWEIWVRAGTYAPARPGGSRNATFDLIDNMYVYGGFAGWESDVSERDYINNVTVLTGDTNRNDDPAEFPLGASYADNAYHVVTDNGPGWTLLDGFTITSGIANGTAPDDKGGGLYNTEGTLSVVRCTFTTNYAYFGGAGMYNTDAGTANLSKCVFSGNTTSALTGYGGGMYSLLADADLYDCRFSGNTSGQGNGGGMAIRSSDATLTKCIFRDNTTQNGVGGAIYADDSLSMTATNCTFSGNVALFGGGLFSDGLGVTTLSNCAFTGNRADGGDGGGMLSNTTGGSSTVANCTFTQNTASGNGGGIHIYSPADLTVQNCILSRNTDSDGSIESSQLIEMFPTSNVVTYNLIDNLTLYSGNGNIAGPALFVDVDGADNTPGTADDNLRLSAGSPAIDMGSNPDAPLDTQDFDGDANTTEPIPYDLDWKPRFVDDPDSPNNGNGTPPLIDMGAYEYFRDCNDSGLPDLCDVDCTALNNTCNVAGCGLSSDCDSTGKPDECDISECDGSPACSDCNSNDEPDWCDIDTSSSSDLVDIEGVPGPDGIPDECMFFDDGGPADSYWNTCANWSGDACPGAGDNVALVGAGTTVDVAADSTAAGVNVGPGVELNLTGGNLTIAEIDGIVTDGSVTVGDGRAIIAAATTRLRGAQPLQLNGATASISSATGSDTVTSEDVIAGYGVVDAALINEGTLQADVTGQTLSIQGAFTKTNDGTFIAKNGAIVYVKTSVTGVGLFRAQECIGAGACVASELRVATGVSIAGTTLEAVDEAIVQVEGTANITLSGPITIDSGGILRGASSPSGTITSSGLLVTAGGGIARSGSTTGGQAILSSNTTYTTTGSIDVLKTNKCLGTRGGCTPPVVEVRGDAFVKSGTMNIAADGKVRISGDRDPWSIRVTGPLTIHSDGLYLGGTPASGKLKAGSIKITGGAFTGVPLSGGGKMLLSGDMQVESEGSFDLVKKASGCVGRGGCTPPELEMTENADVTTATMNLADGGEADVRGGTLDVTGKLTMDAGGTLWGSTPAPGAITAGSADIVGIAGAGAPGKLYLSGTTSMTVSADLTMACPASLRGGCTPPVLSVTDTATLNILGNLVIGASTGLRGAGAVEILVGPGATVSLSGNLDNRSGSSSTFDWSLGKLILSGSSPFFEVSGMDHGPVEAGFDTNFAMGTVEVSAGAHVTFHDAFANNSCDCQALYVDSLDFQSAASVTIDDCKIYYRTLQPGVTPTLIGCAELQQVPGDAPPVVVAEGPRYLAVTPYAGVDPVALRVTGDPCDATAACMSLYIQSDGTLGPTRVEQTPDVWGTVYVSGNKILPSTGYVVQADSGAVGAPILSQSARATTWAWGNVNNSGGVDLEDILCVLEGFSGNFQLCTRQAVDLLGGRDEWGNCEPPDNVINLDDILGVLDAFRRMLYPCADPCP